MYDNLLSLEGLTFVLLMLALKEGLRGGGGGGGGGGGSSSSSSSSIYYMDIKVDSTW